MPMTIDKAIDIISQKDIRIIKLWDVWQVKVRNEGRLNTGMILLFLCERFNDITDIIPKKEYYRLLQKFISATSSKGMIMTRDFAWPKLPPKNPLRSAIQYADQKTIGILIKRAPEAVFNEKTMEAIVRGMSDYPLGYSMSLQCSLKNVREIMLKTTNIEALKQAYQVSSGSMMKKIYGNLSTQIADRIVRLTSSLQIPVNQPASPVSIQEMDTVVFKGSRERTVSRESGYGTAPASPCLIHVSPKANS